MPKIGLDHSDAIELAEMLTFLADWLSGAHKQTLADSLAGFVGQDTYRIDELHADLHRFAAALGQAYLRGGGAGAAQDPATRVNLVHDGQPVGQANGRT